MKFEIEKIKSQLGNSFSSQDSKFFIFTATKLTIIPLLSFCVVFYSLWTIMEMNFNFFVANGFNSGEVFKEAFYDSIIIGVADYLPYFFGVIVSVFLTGLFISWLILRSFDNIETFAGEAIEDPSEDFETHGLNKNKLINQVSRIFFKYLQICQRDGQRPRFKLPRKLENLNHPPFDKVFFLQYVLIVSALCLVTNIILFTFTNELYQELVSKGLELLEVNRVVTNFLKSQESILFNIYFIAIGLNITLYTLISKNIIKSVDGVSFGFARDMIKIIRGEHDIRLRPRYTDPGKSVAAKINEYLDVVFPFIEDEDDSTIEELTQSSYEELHNYVQEDQVEDLEDTHVDSTIVAQEFEYDEEEDYEEVESEQETVISDFEEVNPYLMDEAKEEEELIEEPVHNVVEMQKPIKEHVQQEVPDDLPPPFVEEKQVANGERVFHITTPEGLKVENVDAEMLLRIVKESKK